MAKILVVDDDAVNRELFRWALQENHEIDELTSGVGAADAIRSGQYDLVLLDVMMPIIGGEEVVSDLAGDQVNLLDRVLVGTAAMNQPLVDKLTEQGVAGVKQRPYDPEEIAELVEAFLA